MFTAPKNASATTPRLYCRILCAAHFYRFGYYFLFIAIPLFKIPLLSRNFRLQKSPAQSAGDNNIPHPRFARVGL